MNETIKGVQELVEYFEKGKNFTEELMKENERLRMRIVQIEHQNQDLLSKSDPARINKLLEENRELKQKLLGLEDKFRHIENENKDFTQRYIEIQAQNDNLLNLYVSSYQLHATLDPEEVVEIIEEIILNLIGAEEYFICMMEANGEYPRIVAGEGPDGPITGGASLKEIDTVLQKVLFTGESFFSSNGETTGHLACTPLKVNQDVVGAISISKLMMQKKEGFDPIDIELLQLLADHAATALVSSKLYKRTERKLRTVESFLELLKIQEKSESRAALGV